MNPNDRFLRIALKLDAAASGTLAVASLALSQQMGQWFGTPAAHSLAVGVFLAVYATGLWFLASAKTLSRPAVWVVILGNLGWVAASAVYAFGSAASLTALGMGYVIIQAAGVAVFADLEFVGLRKAAT